MHSQLCFPIDQCSIQRLVQSADLDIEMNQSAPTSFIAIRKSSLVVQTHIPSNPSGQSIPAGSTAVIYEESTEWPGWVKGELNNQFYWFPESILDRSLSPCLITADYNPIELSVTLHETIWVEYAYAGWIWCKNIKNQWGWIPAQCVLDKNASI